MKGSFFSENGMRDLSQAMQKSETLDEVQIQKKLQEQKRQAMLEEQQQQQPGYAGMPAGQGDLMQALMRPVGAMR